MKIIENKRKLKYPSLPFSNKFYYLLLHLALPVNSYPPSTTHLRAARNTARSLGISLSTITIHNNKKMSTNGIGRYVFRFPYYRREDKLSTRFSDSVLLAASITSGPFLGEQKEISCFRIPKALIENRNKIFIGELVESEKSRPWEERTLEFPLTHIGSSSYVSDFSVELAWKLTPLIFNNDNYLRAFRFLKTSQENFFVWPGEIDDVLDNKHEIAKNVFEQSRIENALQECFKAVEAILGEPPKEDIKFFQKINAIGLDPKMKFGLKGEPIFTVIREMNHARDKKAAHGSTPNREITIGDMLVYQDCARFVVLKACENKTGIKIF